MSSWGVGASRALVAVLMVASVFLSMVAPAGAGFNGTYQFTSATGVANAFSMASGATSISFPDDDEGNQSAAPFDIGFPFVLDGTSYTKFSVNTNGLLKLGNDGTSVSTAGFNDPF